MFERKKSSFKSCITRRASQEQPLMEIPFLSVCLGVFHDIRACLTSCGLHPLMAERWMSLEWQWRRPINHTESLEEANRVGQEWLSAALYASVIRGMCNQWEQFSEHGNLIIEVWRCRSLTKRSPRGESHLVCVEETLDLARQRMSGISYSGISTVSFSCFPRKCSSNARHSPWSMAHCKVK